MNFIIIILAPFVLIKIINEIYFYDKKKEFVNASSLCIIPIPEIYFYDHLWYICHINIFVYYFLKYIFHIVTDLSLQSKHDVITFLLCLFFRTVISCAKWIDEFCLLCITWRDDRMKKKWLHVSEWLTDCNYYFFPFLVVQTSF